MCLALSRLSGETNLTAQASSVGGKKHSVSTDYVLKVRGLDVCSDAVVGNDMLRGISGGQRKRVTTGLSLSSPSPVAKEKEFTKSYLWLLFKTST
jgi:ABC-type multidrug transport system ATPase subunit